MLFTKDTKEGIIYFNCFYRYYLYLNRFICYDKNMNKNNVKKQRMYILIFSVLWLLVLSFLYTQLPEIIPMQFNLKGEVVRETSKALFYIVVSLFYGLYLLYCWLRFKDKAIPKKQLITIYFLMFFSLFILILGQVTT